MIFLRFFRNLNKMCNFSPVFMVECFAIESGFALSVKPNLFSKSAMTKLSEFLHRVLLCPFHCVTSAIYEQIQDFVFSRNLFFSKLDFNALPQLDSNFSSTPNKLLQLSRKLVTSFKIVELNIQINGLLQYPSLAIRVYGPLVKILLSIL